jgi:hypothetical protein
MAVLIRATNLPDGPGTEMYDAVGAEMKLAEHPPAGLIFHCAGEIDGEWTITDIWESREAYDRFEKERLVPAIMKLSDDGDGPPPTGEATIEEFPVHDYVKP